MAISCKNKIKKQSFLGPYPILQNKLALEKLIINYENLWRHLMAFGDGSVGFPQDLYVTCSIIDIGRTE